MPDICQGKVILTMNRVSDHNASAVGGEKQGDDEPVTGPEKGIVYSKRMH